MHEPNRLLHELHIAELQRDHAIAVAYSAVSDYLRTLEERDRARDLAATLEHQLQWMTPNWKRNPAIFPSAVGVAIYDGQGHA